MNSKLYVCLLSVLSLLPHMAIAQDQSAAELRRLGRIAFYEGRLNAAEQLLRKSVAMFEAAGDGFRTEIATTRGDLAWLLVATGEYREAEGFLESSLRFLKNRSEDCEHTAIIISHLGTVYHKTERYAAAERLFKEALKQSERCLPSYTEVVLNNLGILYADTGKTKQAKAVFERALAVAEKQSKDTGSDLVLAQTLSNLALVYDARGETSRAEESFAQSIQLLEKSLAGPHKTMAAAFLSIALEGFAQLHFHQGKLDEAEHEFARSKEIAFAAGNTGRVSKVSFELAEVLAAKGKYEDAKILYQQAIQTGGSDTAQTATMLERFSKLLRTMKADRQAEEVEFRAKRIRAAMAYTTRAK